MFTLLVDREADLQAVRDLMENTVQKLPFVIDAPAVSVWLEKIDTLAAESS